MAVVLLASVVGLLLTTFEDICRADVFGRRGVLSWTVLRTVRQPWRTPCVSRLLDLVFQTRSFEIVLQLHVFVLLSLAASLVAGAPDALCAILAFASLVLILLHNVRSIFGLDGAHHMNVVILTAGTLFYVNPPGSLGQTYCLAYIAAHAVLAYFVSGVAKLLDGTWRRGLALVGILGTKIYGHAWLSGVLRRHRLLSWMGCWLVIGFESVFPLALLSNEPVLAGALLLGAAFHAGTAVFMGLNNFFFAFVATYPAIVFTHSVVRRALDS